MEAQRHRLGEILSNHLRERGIEQKDVAEAIGTSHVTLNRYLKDRRVIDLDILDALTRYLGYPDGYFYPYYDCWKTEGRQVHGLHKRVRSFILRCHRLGMPAWISKNVANILEYGSYDDLLQIGKALVKENRLDEALPYFDLVVYHEQDKLSPVLAECYYQRFLIVRDWDMEYAWEAGIKLAEYLKNMEGNLQYEAYTKVINLLFVLDRWEHVETYSSELATLLRHTRKDTVSETLYGDALVNLGFAYRKLGEYTKCLETIQQYEQINTGKYRLWAKANRIILDIVQGDVERVSDLCEYARKYPEEAFAILDIILETLVTHDKLADVAHFLGDFQTEIAHLYTLSNPRDAKRIIRFRYYTALLLLKTKQRDWLDELIAAITLASRWKFQNLHLWCYELVLCNFHAIDADSQQRFVSLLLFPESN